MAVDIRTLRIGSHVLVNSVRATVERLEIRKWQDGIQRPWGFFHGIVNGTYRECGGFLDIDNVMPIPITPELLEELGFEEMYWSYEKSFVKPLQRKGFGRNPERRRRVEKQKLSLTKVQLRRNSRYQIPPCAESFNSLTRTRNLL